MEQEKVQERDWGWVFHVLTKGPASQRCQIPMPDTIIFKDSEPCRWLFTSKAGTIMSRSGNKLKLAKIKRRFMDRHMLVEGDEDADKPACVVRKAGGDPLKVELMSAGELTALAADTSGGLRAGIVALQDYIEAERPTNLRCKYIRTDEHTGMAKGYRIETHKMNEVSAATQKIFNQAKQKDIRTIKSQMSEVNQLVESITFRIVRFIESRVPMVVLSMAAEFVMDDYNQAWFTHCAELITGPKAARWKPPSGNFSRLEPNRRLRPHLVRKKPLKDGTPVCCGDYCHANVNDIINPPEDEQGTKNPNVTDLSIFTNESKIDQIEKDAAPIDYSKPVVGVRSLLSKSVFLARMEKNAVDTSLMDELLYKKSKRQLEQRMLPQIRPTASSKHSLHDYYDMVPVCDKCFKVYCHLDRERAMAQIESPVAKEEEDTRKSSPLFGGGVPTELPPADDAYDMSAKGIRQRLTDLYTAQAKPMSSSPTFVPSANPLSGGMGSTLASMGMRGAPIKRSVTVMEKDHTLPNLATQKNKAFPRSKSSMLGKITQHSGGDANMLPSLV